MIRKNCLWALLGCLRLTARCGGANSDSGSGTRGAARLGLGCESHVPQNEYTRLAHRRKGMRGPERSGTHVAMRAGRTGERRVLRDGCTVARPWDSQHNADRLFPRLP